MTVQIIHGDCLEAMRGLADASVDSVVTDPPAGIGFMGRAWDHHKGGRDQWIAWMQGLAAECLRVCKPGSHALVWALPRTSHWTATAWENAGWEVRDRVAFLFGSGFPKSQNVGKAFDKAAGAERKAVGVREDFAARANKKRGDGQWREGSGFQSPDQIGVITAPATDLAKQWNGWGTALKPAMEDWWLLRRPLIGIVTANVAAHGTGALNIERCRVGTSKDVPASPCRNDSKIYGKGSSLTTGDTAGFDPSIGRWPANLAHDGSDEVLEAFAAFGERPSRPAATLNRRADMGYHGGSVGQEGLPGCINDTGTAARFFFSAKAGREERGEGNSHPTVKPLALMQWLCRLVTPPGGTVLDPFAGSGSTLIAADREQFHAIGIEREAEYVEIARRRVAGEAPLLASVA